MDIQKDGNNKLFFLKNRAANLKVERVWNAVTEGLGTRDPFPGDSTFAQSTVAYAPKTPAKTPKN